MESASITGVSPNDRPPSSSSSSLFPPLSPRGALRAHAHTTPPGQGERDRLPLLRALPSFLPSLLLAPPQKTLFPPFSFSSFFFLSSPTLRSLAPSPPSDAPREINRTQSSLDPHRETTSVCPFASHPLPRPRGDRDSKVQKGEGRGLNRYNNPTRRRSVSSIYRRIKE